MIGFILSNANLTAHLNFSSPDERVCGFAHLSGTAALIHMQKIFLLLRMCDGARSLLCLGWTGVCGDCIAQHQVDMYGLEN